ncbi:MAG: response regulator, partial [Myxococcales bacterium]
MAQRSVLCIEPDGAAVSEIRRAFGAYGFRVESIPNGGHSVEWARTNNPTLIVLSVEPRKVGYAICNKLKRSPNLREIPLILISAEETRATFEQHKKLKSRAEEYLLKPLDIRELLAKANRLITLGDAQGAADDDEAEIELADDEIAEVSLDDDELMDAEEGFAASDPPTQATARVPFPDAGVGASGDRNGRGNGALGAASDDEALAMGESLGSLGDFSRPHLVSDASGPSPFAETSNSPTGQSPARSGADMPFDSEQFDQETQAAFAALEAGVADRITTTAASASGRGTASASSATPTNGDVVDLQSLWGDADLPAKMPWEQTTGAVPASSATA